MTFVADRGRHLLVVLLIPLVLTACGSKQVVVEGSFPTPLLEPLPLSIGVVYPPAFANHEFFDEAKGRSESDWLVKTGPAQVEFWDIMLGSMFEQVVTIDSPEVLATWAEQLDAVLVPALDDLQYTIPLHTSVKVYEIWMRYRFRLVEPTALHSQEDGGLAVDPEEHLAEWSLTAYGKTPTAFMQTDEAAVNIAAVVALRDAGANFATTFERVPEVIAWRETRVAGE